MSCYVGIDIGAISGTAALLIQGQDDLPPRAAEKLHPLSSRSRGDEKIYISPYRRTRGKPIATARELLEEIIAIVGSDRIKGVCLTGSGAKVAGAKLAAAVVNEFKAIAAGLTATDLAHKSDESVNAPNAKERLGKPSAEPGAEVCTVFEMGGETSKYLRLSRNEDGTFNIIDYATNGDCAAGTGSFLDQQAGRLKFSIEQVGPLVLNAQRAAQIAGRCSVFAKSDMVHAQQKGYSPAEVLRGLCNAVARNFRTAVVRSHPVVPPVAFIGGVAANAAVVRAMREAFALGADQLIIPQAFAHLPAIGAAIIASWTCEATDLAHMSQLRAASDTTRGVLPTAAPLSMQRVLLLRDRVEPYELPFGEEKIDAYLGIDVGSVSTNLVVIDEAGSVIYEIYTETQGRPIEVASEGLAEIHRELGRRIDIRGVGTTGSGRELIGQLVGADTINDEITAHKTGAMFVGRRMLDGQIPDTIFEIGGQDSKYISLQDGVVVDFTMNDACAAGTGSFLEERAEELGISIKDEFAALALSSRAPIRLGERCTVFMERDVNSYMQRGAQKADLVAGLAYSVVQNYINRVVRGRKIGQCIFFQGGTAYNDAVAAAFTAVTGKEIIVPPHNGVVGAIGAALLARDKMTSPVAKLAAPSSAGQLGTYVSQSKGPLRESRFRDYDLSQVNYSLREFTCKGCSNSCQIQEFNVEDEKTYWGDKCSDRYRKAAKAEQQPVIEDLFGFREKLLLDESNLPAVADNALTVGIPLTMFAYESLPFWRTMLGRCGFRTVLSEPTNKRIVQAGLDTVVAEPCFPIIAAHGHVVELTQRQDVQYILLPNLISMESRWSEVESHLCPWHQTLPFVCRQAPALQPNGHRFLMPTLHFREGPKLITRQLQDYFKLLGVSKRAVAAAVQAGYQAQKEFQIQILTRGQMALTVLQRSGAKCILLLGRPYNIHDAGMNLAVANKLRDRYGVNCLPLDSLDTDAVDIRDVNNNMYWVLGQRAIAAAKLVRRHPNLHIIYITNFKCGPDSFIKHFIRSASGKPFLTLQFDGHSNDAGIMTRCEAYLDSIGVLRPWRREELVATTA